MTRTRDARTTLAWVLGAAVLLAMVPMLFVVWIESDGADGGALEALAAVTPLTRPGDRAEPASASVARQREQPLPAALALPGIAEAELLGPEAGYFAGVPRAWTAPFTLRGRVVNEAGEPIVGASLMYKPDETSERVVLLATGETSRDLPVTTTDADGRFEFQSLRGRPTSTLPGFDDGPPSSWLLGNDDLTAGLFKPLHEMGFQEADFGTIVWSGGFCIRGRVVTVEGKPLGGILVRSLCARSRSGGDAERVTDADGFYEFLGIGPSSEYGGTSIHVEHPGMLRAHIRVPNAPDGSIARAPDLVAEPGLSITGVVRDGDGQPVAGAGVCVFDRGWNGPDGERWRDDWREATAPDAPAAVFTDSEGRFRVSGLTNDECFVLAGAAGFEPTLARKVWPEGPPVLIALSPARSTTAERVLLVMAVDGDDRPVVDARAFVSTRSELHGGRFRWESPMRMRDDLAGDGRFAVFLGGEEDCVVKLIAPGFTSRCVIFTEQDISLTKEHHVVLVPERRVSGVVVDDADQPVPFARISLRPTGDGRAERLHVDALSDESGHFAFGGLGPGCWESSARADGMVEDEAREFTLDDSESVHELDLALHRCGVIEGFLRRVDGSPPPAPERPNVFIDRVSEGKDCFQGERSDADGWFHFTTEGLGIFRVRGPLGAQTEVCVRGGEVTRVNLVVPSDPVISGLVLAGDRPVAGARILCSDGSPDYASEGWPFLGSSALASLPLSDEHGRFTLKVSKRGEFHVRAVVANGGTSGTQLVTLEPGSMHRLELHMEEGRVQGVVVDGATGAPVPKVNVGIPGRLAVVTGADGRFLIEQVPQGEGVLCVAASGWLVPDSVPLNGVSGHGATELTITVWRESHLVVDALGPNGLPAPAMIALWKADGTCLSGEYKTHTQWAEGGHMKFDRLGGGRYKVAISTDSGLLWYSAIDEWERACPGATLVDLAPGETRRVVLRLDETSAEAGASR